MLQRYLEFIRGASGNWTGTAGVSLTTGSLAVFIMLELLRMTGVVTSSYVGLLTYLVFPTMFLGGLALVWLGWRRLRTETGLQDLELQKRRFGAPAFRTVAVLTLLNILIIGFASMRTLSFMDGPEFCGTACHSVMNPEWVTYQNSPHARVRCVDCHVGEGAAALIDSKLNGAYQMLSISLDLLERPIPTPVHSLRPARETCEKCHWPEKFYGNRLVTKVAYGDDPDNTPSYTSLMMKIDTAYGSVGRSGIHWHIQDENTIRYAPADDRREEILWVSSRQPDGSHKKYSNTLIAGELFGQATVRTMDCVDCHNRATHIYRGLDEAVDVGIRKGEIDRSLPFIRKASAEALSAGYRDRDAAMRGISDSVLGFYRRRHPDLFRSRMSDIESVVRVLQHIYNRNIHPEMNIHWGTYPDHIGHRNGPGCFRCHNRYMQDEDGISIKHDCTMCHSILAIEERKPLQYLDRPEERSRNGSMYPYLREEFKRSVGADKGVQ